MKQILFSPTLRKRKPKITSQESLVNPHLLEQELSKLWGEAQDLCAHNKLDEAYTKLTPYCVQINDSKYTSFLNLAGLIALQLNKHDDGLSLLSQSNTLDPDQIEVHYNLSIIYRQKKDYKSALSHLSKSLELNPKHQDSLYNRANILETLGFYESALLDMQQLIQLDQSANIYNLFGLIEKGLKNYPHALKLFNQALKLDPQNIQILNNLAIIYKKNKDYSKAKHMLTKALEFNPNIPLTLNNLGFIFEETNQLDEAIKYYQKSQQLNPNPANSYNLGLAQLKIQDFRNGWINMESRWEIDSFKKKLIHSKKSRWNGEKCASILVWGEQGIGDEILYSSMLKDLEGYCQKIYYACLNHKILTVFQRSYKSIQVLSMDDITDDDFFDFHIPVASLGQFFRSNLDSFPVLNQSIVADKKIKDKFQLNTDLPLIGISWRSNAGEEKNINLSEFEPLANGQFELINLQYQITGKEKKALEAMNIKHQHDFDLFNDLEATCALIDCCDYIVTSSNINAHIAGALSKPTFLLSAKGIKQFHYWCSPTNRSLWYPSVQIVHQSKASDWHQEFTFIRNQLKS
jgi:tetratricopeptide (TPR) repeat protein